MFKMLKIFHKSAGRKFLSESFAQCASKNTFTVNCELDPPFKLIPHH
jgi:hypothetical protein